MEETDLVAFVEDRIPGWDVGRPSPNMGRAVLGHDLRWCPLRKVIL